MNSLSDDEILDIRGQHATALILDGEILNFASDILAAADRKGRGSAEPVSKYDDEEYYAHKKRIGQILRPTDEMVNRFLSWKLPKNFNPDGGISFKREYNEHTPWGPNIHEPIGTNLLDAAQARAMLEHVIGAPSVPNFKAQTFLQPGWNHVLAAFVDGAREARANPTAGDDDFKRAADGYTKRVHEEVDPESERRLRENDWPQVTDDLVLRITTAYEQGFGHGQQRRDLPNPYSEGSPEFEAWGHGYEVAESRSAPSVQEPTADRNMEGAAEFIRALLFNTPIWPNAWGQDVAAAAFFLTDGGNRERAVLSVGEPTAEKYDDVLLPFVALMRRELHANSGKGDRSGWLSMSRQTAMLEIWHHAAKLQKAALNDDQQAIQEYAADTANMAMMLVDVCGALSVGEPGAPGGWRQVIADARLGLGAGSRSASNTDFEVTYGGALLDHIEEKLEALSVGAPGGSVSPEPPAEAAWLIEHSGVILGVVQGQVSWLRVDSAKELGHTLDASKALRFARKEDAEAVLSMYLRSISTAWHRAIYSVTEHMWPSAALSSVAPEQPKDKA